LSFDKIEGKGFFTREIEDALLRGDIDMAVHSMKDLPTTSPKGLSITALSYREEPVDCLLIRSSEVDTEQMLQLKKGAIVGTSSARRKAQILDARPDVSLKDIRGNVPTRINKLRSGDFDGIVLAAAGINRLEEDISDLYSLKLNAREFNPSPAQGVLAFQTCTDDLNIRRILKNIHHSEVALVTNIERKVLQLMDGGCHIPLGVYCERDANNHYHVWASMAAAWDQPLVRVQQSSSTSYQLAEKIAASLKSKIQSLS